MLKEILISINYFTFILKNIHTYIEIFITYLLNQVIILKLHFNNCRNKLYLNKNNYRNNIIRINYFY